MNLLEIFYDYKSSVEFHDELNPKLWQDTHLKEEVKNHLLKIANEFVEFIDIKDFSYQDLIICGSSANYNYTQYSDIDLHLIVNFDNLPQDCPALAQNFFDTKKALWNKIHEIDIYGIPVEVYVENIKNPVTSGGIYSLIQDEWLRSPKKVKMQLNDKAIESKAKNLAFDIDQIIDNNEDNENAQKILDKIYRLRKSGLARSGEYSVENLTFKSLRNSGHLQKIKDYLRKSSDKKLSLESVFR